MDEPEKPFACSLPGCGQTFTNEDHLHVHKKKHDMMLQFGLEQKAAFVADQTPTPTRFIRNCEEVGLFQDLQNVNPFDEGFKRAMETKAGIHSLEAAIAADDTLHTPQMFPVDGDSALYTATNNQRNITISRSSSDESGAVKEYETTTISKLTNEVTTISRIVEKESTDKTEDNGAKNKDFVKGNSVSYTNNVIKIQSNVEIRKDTTDLIKNVPKAVVYKDSIIKDATSIVKKDVLLTDKLPPIMSQKSLDLVVDSLNDFNSNNNRRIVNKKTVDDKIKGSEPAVKRQVSKHKEKVNETMDFEVLITINGKKVRMKPVEETNEMEKELDAKEKLKSVLENKIKKENDVMKGSAIIHNLPITGTLIPVNLISKPIIIANTVTKLPIPNLKNDFKVPSKKVKLRDKPIERDSEINAVREGKGVKRKDDKTDILSMRSAASKRYRERLKDKMHHQGAENRKLKDYNQKLMAENVALKRMVMEHLKTCPDAEGFRSNFAAHSFNP